MAGLEGPAPTSEYGTRKKVKKRILPAFGDIPLSDLDASTIGAWKSAMLAEQLPPQTVNTYLSLLGTILNAAVDDDYLARSPLVRKSGAGRTAATRNQPVPRREVWLLREQLDRLVEAIDPRYRALVLVAALTGMRWGELVALRWDDPRFEQPLDDGAVRGPGRLRIARAISDPRRTGRGVDKGPKTEAGKRIIALDQETVQALLAHRELVGGGPYDRIFTSSGGSRGPAGTVARNNFHRVWPRRLWADCGSTPAETDLVRRSSQPLQRSEPTGTDQRAGQMGRTRSGRRCGRRRSPWRSSARQFGSTPAV
jgi:integrase